MTADELSSFKKDLYSLLVEAADGPADALAAIKRRLPEASPKFSTAILIEARLNTLNRDRAQGTLSADELRTAQNRLNADLMAFISSLAVADFELSAAGAASPKSGSILYKIPHTMEAGHDHKCLVRLAFEQASLLRDIEVTADTVVKGLRVSEVMEVELLDPSPSPAFEIRRLNSPEQFLEKNEYTEWVFYVKPRLAGSHPLVLKVSVKELINDRERTKEIVLEELITVVTDPAPVAEAEGFARAGYSFSYSTAPESPVYGAPVQHLPPEPPVKPPVYHSAPAPVRQPVPQIVVPAPVVPAPAMPSHGVGQPTMAEPSRGGSRQRSAMMLIFGFIAASGLLAAAGVAVGLLPNPFKQTPEPVPPPAVVGDSSATGSGTSLTGTDTSLFSEEKTEATDDAPATEPAKKEESPAAKPPKTGAQSPAAQPPKPPKDGLESEKARLTDPPVKKRKSGFDMIAVPSGSVAIDPKDCNGKPAVEVRGFRIGKYEVTQADWREVMGSNPSKFGCADCPVERVSWEMAVDFAKKASEKKGKRYRLPNEAEWELAARGPGGAAHSYSGGNDAAAVAWFKEIQVYTHEVGTKRHNSLGIYDMSGNVWEWCQGRFPTGSGCPADEASPKKRVKRGGSWAEQEKLSKRKAVSPKERDPDNGLRLVEE